MEKTTNLNRRSWLKYSALAAGGVVTSAAFPAFANSNPALGMKPYQGKYSLMENYHVMMADRADMKARLLANENPWGPSKKAVAAIAASASMGNRYVYNSSAKMVDFLAEKEGVSKESILLSPGSTDILEKVAFSLFMNGGNIVSADPSYMSMIRTTQSIGGTWKNIPLKADYSHDLDAMAAAIDDETKLVYICNPNNPTGTMTPVSEIKAFCKKVSSKVPVFIDEAYMELLDNPEANTAVSLVQEGYDVIICRTFSKIHGMAGLRLGYMAANEARVKAIKSMVRTEMGISVTSLEGGMASLKDVEFQEFTRKHNKENREYVFAELKKAGMNPIPSFTSFILFPIQVPTKEFLTQFMDRGVGIRGFEIDGKPYARVSMGTMDEVKLFTKSLYEIVS
ncbi:histidinol-phosphate transaminase [uncultured Imperialibacter sp.]|uniref:pyridoxal phosphate-dependent aminotransferase n=1 Tax=uncultured Imperialibacter sp. TaxID=1672639 RepID=UPI0030D99467|tara:strand:- start:112832 stop:114019 length:1188 start_codon:yes stop_codon:yes gene_type:complete